MPPLSASICTQSPFSVSETPILTPCLFCPYQLLFHAVTIIGVNRIVAPPGPMFYISIFGPNSLVLLVTLSETAVALLQEIRRLRMTKLAIANYSSRENGSQHQNLRHPVPLRFPELLPHFLKGRASWTPQSREHGGGLTRRP